MRKNSSVYYSNFKDAMRLIEEKGMVSSNKAKKRLYNKLLIESNKNPFSVNRYLQGVSEILFWIYAAKNNLIIETDYKLNSSNAKDVDVRIKTNNHFFNIEIKCPDQEVRTDNHLLLSYAYRVQGVSKIKIDEMMNKLEEMIQPGIDEHPEMGITGSECKKTNDNKIINYMDSAQEKFAYSDSEMNILVISVPSNEMQYYYNYLWNPESGILAGELECFNRRPEEFDKIDVVVLTNIVSGHSMDVGMNAWDLNNYCTIGFINPNSYGIKKHTKPLSEMLNVIPDEAIRFQKEREKVLARDLPRGIPVDEMVVFEYLVNNHSILYSPNEKRTMWFKNGKINPKIF